MISHPGIVRGVDMAEITRMEVNTILQFSNKRCDKCYQECAYGRFGACKGQLLVPLNREGGEDYGRRN